MINVDCRAVLAVTIIAKSEAIHNRVREFGNIGCMHSRYGTRQVYTLPSRTMGARVKITNNFYYALQAKQCTLSLQFSHAGATSPILS